VCVTMAHGELLKVHTERRTPIPVKITLTGEDICKIK
jgi:hypothetical protein